jgi:hypothetical protein
MRGREGAVLSASQQACRAFEETPSGGGHPP